MEKLTAIALTAALIAGVLLRNVSDFVFGVCLTVVMISTVILFNLKKSKRL